MMIKKTLAALTGALLLSCLGGTALAQEFPPSKTVTLYFRTVSGTAVGGRDFVVKTGSVTIGPGQTKATVGVQTLQNATIGRRFSLELMPQPGVTFTTRIASVQIF